MPKKVPAKKDLKNLKTISMKEVVKKIQTNGVHIEGNWANPALANFAADVFIMHCLGMINPKPGTKPVHVRFL